MIKLLRHTLSFGRASSDYVYSILQSLLLYRSKWQLKNPLWYKSVDSKDLVHLKKRVNFINVCLKDDIMFEICYLTSSASQKLYYIILHSI